MAAAQKVRLLILLASFALLCSCRSALPVASPELADWEEPAEWMHPPQDEAQRRELPNGCFSGLQFSAAGSRLEAEDEPQGLELSAVIENSPAAAAGLRTGDRVLEARVQDRVVLLDAVSDWRQLELELAPQTPVSLRCERGSRELEAQLTLAARVAPAARTEPMRERESQRAGILVREASEAQSRAAGLPPGAGVVLIGMARSSPWRTSALRYGDLLVAVDGERIDQPARLMRAIRSAPDEARLRIGYVRDGALAETQVALSQRTRGVREFRVPLLFSWRSAANSTKWSALIGLLSWESNPSAWELGVLWLIRMRGGDSERLEELR